MVKDKVWKKGGAGGSSATLASQRDSVGRGSVGYRMVCQACGDPAPYKAFCLKRCRGIWLEQLELNNIYKSKLD